MTLLLPAITLSKAGSHSSDRVVIAAICRAYRAWGERMVDVIGFLSLGIFTTHVTGNIVVVGALIVRHNRVHPAQILAIPVFILAVAVTWLIAKASGRRGTGLMQLLLLIQFLLITCVLIFSVITKPSADPHGLIATIAAMIAVSAMGCQFALLRLTLPVAPSTAVMTGNLANAVLGLVDLSSRTQPLIQSDSKRLTGALHRGLRPGYCSPYVFR